MLASLLKRAQTFITVMFMRYLYLSEMYMVELWEKVIFHIMFALLFMSFWYFNYCIISSVGFRSVRTNIEGVS